MKNGFLMALEIALLIGMGVWVYVSLTETSKISRPGGVEVTVQLQGASDKAILFKDSANRDRYVILRDGKEQELSPDELANTLYTERAGRSWLQKICNVSNPFGFIWVGLGLLGQVLFTGRMVVQWLASEKSKKSVVPPIFWWMSLIGSSMLMAYFLWRRDPIGLLGQTFGWFIYVRNLWMIYRPHAAAEPSPLEADAKEAMA